MPTFTKHGEELRASDAYLSVTKFSESVRVHKALSAFDRMIIPFLQGSFFSSFFLLARATVK